MVIHPTPHEFFVSIGEASQKTLRFNKAIVQTGNSYQELLDVLKDIQYDAEGTKNEALERAEQVKENIKKMVEGAAENFEEIPTMPAFLVVNEISVGDDGEMKAVPLSDTGAVKVEGTLPPKLTAAGPGVYVVHKTITNDAVRLKVLGYLIDSIMWMNVFETQISDEQIAQEKEGFKRDIMERLNEREDLSNDQKEHIAEQRANEFLRQNIRAMSTVFRPSQKGFGDPISEIDYPLEYLVLVVYVKKTVRPGEGTGDAADTGGDATLDMDVYEIDDEHPDGEENANEIRIKAEIRKGNQSRELTIVAKEELRVPIPEEFYDGTLHLTPADDITLYTAGEGGQWTAVEGYDLQIPDNRIAVENTIFGSIYYSRTGAAGTADDSEEARRGITATFSVLADPDDPRAPRSKPLEGVHDSLGFLGDLDRTNADPFEYRYEVYADKTLKTGQDGNLLKEGSGSGQERIIIEGIPRRGHILRIIPQGSFRLVDADDPRRGSSVESEALDFEIPDEAAARRKFFGRVIIKWLPEETPEILNGEYIDGEEEAADDVIGESDAEGETVEADAEEIKRGAEADKGVVEEITLLPAVVHDLESDDSAAYQTEEEHDLLKRLAERARTGLTTLRDVWNKWKNREKKDKKKRKGKKDKKNKEKKEKKTGREDKREEQALAEEKLENAERHLQTVERGVEGDDDLTQQEVLDAARLLHEDFADSLSLLIGELTAEQIELKEKLAAVHESLEQIEEELERASGKDASKLGSRKGRLVQKKKQLEEEIDKVNDTLARLKELQEALDERTLAIAEAYESKLPGWFTGLKEKTRERLHLARDAAGRRMAAAAEKARQWRQTSRKRARPPNPGWVAGGIHVGGLHDEPGASDSPEQEADAETPAEEGNGPEDPQQRSGPRMKFNLVGKRAFDPKKPGASPAPAREGAAGHETLTPEARAARIKETRTRILQDEETARHARQDEFDGAVKRVAKRVFGRRKE